MDRWIEYKEIKTPAPPPPPQIFLFSKQAEYRWKKMDKKSFFK